MANAFILITDTALLFTG